MCESTIDVVERSDMDSPVQMEHCASKTMRDNIIAQIKVMSIADVVSILCNIIIITIY